MSFIKRINVIAVCVIISINAYGQAESGYFDKFKRSFTRNIPYPTALVNKCTPTTTFLKINVGKNGTITSMVLSNSADSTLKASFRANRDRLDMVSFKSYIKKAAIKNVTLLIPVYIYFKHSECVLKGIDATQLTHLLKFGKDDFAGSAIILSPIDYSFAIDVNY
jgi:hypothetical protein